MRCRTGGEGRGGSKFTTGPASEAPEEGAECVMRPRERLTKIVRKKVEKIQRVTEDEERQRGAERRRGRETDIADRAVKSPCTLAPAGKVASTSGSS